ARKQRVAQLVSHQRGDQQRSRDDACDPGEPERESGNVEGHGAAGHAPGKERADQQDAPVGRDPDPGNTGDGEAVSVHGAVLMVLRGPFICMNVPMTAWINSGFYATAERGTRRRPARTGRASPPISANQAAAVSSSTHGVALPGKPTVFGDRSPRLATDSSTQAASTPRVAMPGQR